MSTSEIPLRRLSVNGYTHSISSTKSTLPPLYASSFESTGQGLLPSLLPSFKPTLALQIQARGVGLVTLGLSKYELCIPIFAFGENSMVNRPKWLSIRPSKKSGTCCLVDAEDESQTPIARTTYRWGPGRPPVVRIGADENAFAESDEDELPIDCDFNTKAMLAKINDKNSFSGVSSAGRGGADEFPLTVNHLLTRTVQFTSPRYGTFEWRYCSRKEKAAFPSTSTSVSSAPNNLLVLEKIFKNGHGKEIGRLRVAQLIRNDETRTPGTKRSSAGNGGRLEMCLSRGGDDGEDEVLIDEVTVVATVLVMLKKEIDKQD
ncbi:hypothetical protein VTL71DRAFT_11178 [Oculimacula yallundae]|uniref:Uncharacterized protein n=1 Tax=Oculimacula yallundae TaxID=86028 RepID=A0ABR4CVJ1_9HELO